uniref:phage portal protein n=1 Tax=Streptomyces sp. NRRL S-1896 TaxID=1463893 RepID=UPI0004CDCD96
MERSELQWLTHLIRCHDRELPELKELNSYYEGKQPLSYMAPELEHELDDRVRQVVINWPRLVVDSIEERLDVEGFRFPGQPAADEDLWRILYLPDATSWWVKERGEWVEDPEHERDDHGIGEVMVEVLANRPRLKSPNGTSELADVIPLSDAACKIATDMMVSAEYHATPRRVAFGFGEEDFQDEAGRKISAFSRIIGRMWATEKDRKNDGADVIQFPEASLTNFHDTLKQLAVLVASISGMPPHFLGQATDNPASADGIRSVEARTVKRAERKQRASGTTWERVM